MKIDLKQIEIKDLNGVVYRVDDLHRQLGNVLFVNAPSIELSDIARQLHAGEAVEMDAATLQAVTEIIDRHRYYVPFAHRQILEFLRGKSPQPPKGASKRKA